MTREYIDEDGMSIIIGDHVKIRNWSNPMQYSEGTVYKIVKISSTPTVILQNGAKGYVMEIINSEDKIKERIMSEGQYTENKQSFGSYIMRTKAIPHTVQSFLNSEGGYLYIGIRDSGNITERLAGLDYDFNLIDKDKKLTPDKICDMLERRIMLSLNKYLESEANIGPLVQIKFVDVCDVTIIEVKIKRSPKPWFYRNISKSNKPKQFELHCDNEVLREQMIDDFYIRDGGGKKLLQTHKEFYTYAKNRFRNSFSNTEELW